MAADTRTGETAADAALREQAVALLRDAHRRVTQPRVALLSLLLAAGDAHLSADDLLDQVTRRHADVHRATVYRTLDSLVETGIVSHVHLDRGQRAYHLTPAATVGRSGGHLHGQCVSCGRVVDLPADSLAAAAAQIRAETGFVLDAGHVALSGTCSECAAAARHTAR